MERKRDKGEIERAQERCRRMGYGAKRSGVGPRLRECVSSHSYDAVTTLLPRCYAAVTPLLRATAERSLGFRRTFTAIREERMTRP